MLCTGDDLPLCLIPALSNGHPNQLRRMANATFDPRDPSRHHHARSRSPSRAEPQGDAAVPAPLLKVTDPHLTAQRSACRTTLARPGATGPRFFSPAQAHVAGSARSASAATNTPSRSATTPSYGTAPQALPERTSRAAGCNKRPPTLLRLAGPKGMRDPPATQTGTNVPAAERPTMGPKDALERRRLNPSPHTSRERGRSNAVRPWVGRKVPSPHPGLHERF